MPAGLLLWGVSRIGYRALDDWLRALLLEGGRDFEQMGGGTVS